MDQTLHVLRRTTHGPAPVDRLAVEARGGIAAWLTDQLQSSEDPVCDAEVATRFPLTVLPPKEIWIASGKTFSSTPHVHVAAAHAFRQLTSTRQLYEQVVDAFFNHINVPFTSDAGVWTYPSYYADVVRKNAYGRYADMLAAMVKNGAMLQYLNADQSTKNNPNENLGRELLELHTVGIKARYTEHDVRQCALVLTGLSIDYQAGEYLYRPERHYVGHVSVLGWSSANRSSSGEAVALSLVDHLAHHPSTARRVATMLATRFVSDTPSKRLVDDLAAVYLANDTSIVPVLTALFAHPEFGRSGGLKMRRPSQQALAFARTCGVLPTSPISADGSVSMIWAFVAYGDAMLNRPTPDGFPDVATYWLSTQSRLAALDSAGRTLDGWGNGLSQPSALELRPGLPWETGGAVWTPLTSVTAAQVVDALCIRHLGGTLPHAHRAAVAKAAGWNLHAPAAQLISYDNGLPAAVALLAGHPEHTVR